MPAEQPPTPPAGVRNLLELAREHLGMELAFVGEFRGEDELMRVVVGDETKVRIHQDTSIPLEGSYCHRMVDGTLSCFVPDARSDARVNRLRVTRTANIGAYIGVPIVFSDGRLYGAFCCLSSSPVPSLAERDAQFLKVLAVLAAEELEREEEGERAKRIARDGIRSLMDPGGCLMVFQPVEELWSGKVFGFEALARFAREPVRTPDLWFDEAWALGLGPALEIAAIRSALLEVPKLPADCYVSLNVSPATIVCGDVDKLLSGLDSRMLVLEITEHAAVEDYQALASALRPLRERGLRLAIDDTGSGYASLRHILRLRPDAIKLDVSLTRGIDNDPALLALASGLTSFASRIQAVVVAEGVETPSEAAALRALGVRFAQGYLIGRPAPAEQFPRGRAPDAPEAS
ncbi:MAG: sensor domain-containing phosphodiesterase [Actinomycetota bacterium]